MKGPVVLVDVCVAGLALLWLWLSLQLEVQLCDPDCSGWPKPHTGAFFLVHAACVVGSLGLLAGVHFAQTARWRGAVVGIGVAFSCAVLWVVMVS